MVRLLLALLAAGLVIWVGRPMLSLLAPFVAALITAAILNPLVRRLQRRLCWSRRALTMVLLVVLFGLLGADAYLRTCTDTPSVIAQGTAYLQVCCCLSFGCFTQLMFERMLQATGKTVYTMITQTTGAVINIILDPILIFGLFGFPKMGITGAAAATVIGQMIAAVLAVVINQTRNKEIQLSLKGFRPDGTIIGQIYAIGVPSIVMQAIGSVMNYGMNRILIGFSSTATAVFGVYFKLQSFVFMPAFGLNNGVIPVMAYNYGAGSRERVVKTLRHTEVGGQRLRKTSE